MALDFIGQAPPNTVPANQPITYTLRTTNQLDDINAESTIGVGITIRVNGNTVRADSGEFSSNECIVDPDFPFAFACVNLSEGVSRRPTFTWNTPARGESVLTFQGSCQLLPEQTPTAFCSANSISQTTSVEVATRSLTVEVIGSGRGIVAAEPDENDDGISCPDDCSGTYRDGETVTLVADPRGRSVLEGWSGCDSNPTTDTCMVNLSANRNVTVTFVEPPLLVEPVADAGADQTALDSDGSGAESVRLDGTGSEDPDGNIVSYRWLENGQEIATGVTPTVSLALGEHTLTLQVTDNDGLSGEDRVTVTVQTCRDVLTGSACGGEFGLPCVSLRGSMAEPIADILGGQGITFTGPLSGIPGSENCVGWRSDLGGSQAGAVCLLQLLPSEFRLQDADQGITCRTDGFPYNIFTAEQTPSAPMADAGPDQELTDSDNNGSEQVTLDGRGSSDADGSIVSYLWLANGQAIASGATPTVELGVGVHALTLRVTDDDGLTAEDRVTITIEESDLPQCDPTLICGEAITCVDGQLYPTTCGPANCDAPIGPCESFDRTVTVDLSGSGEGSVRAEADENGDGIACPGDCTGTYEEGAVVTLEAIADATSRFGGWSEGCERNPSPTQCQLTVGETGARVSARFDAIEHRVNVRLSGEGTGTVVAAADGLGDGIACPQDCVGTYAADATVMLLATADGESRFGGWSGCDRLAERSCALTLGSDRTVVARFDPVAVADDHGCPPEGAATSVAIPGRTAGELEVGADRDCFSITLPGAGRLSLSSSGETDTVGTLSGAEGPIGSDNDSGPGGNFLLEAELGAGTYGLEVGGLNEFTTGPYTVNVAFSEAAAIPQITPPSTLAERLEVPGEVDRFAIGLEQAGTLSVHTSGSTDTVGTLRDAAGNTLAVNDRIDESDDNFRLEAELPAGDYLLAVAGFGEASGPYTLEVGFAPAAPPAEPTPIAPSEAVVVEAPAAQELFCIDVPSRGELTLTTEGGDDANTFDTLIEQASGTPIAFSSDGRADDQARSIRVTLDPGTYCLLVRALPAPSAARATTPALGSYTVSASFAPGKEVEDTHGDETATATAIELDSLSKGTLGRAADRDLFHLALPAAGALSVQTQGTTDTVVVLKDAAGLEIGRNDDGLDGNNGQLTRILRAGEYFAQIEGFEKLALGEYQLQVSFRATPEPAPSETLRLLLEEPAPGSVYSGVANIRGWAFDAQDPEGIARIELFVDGEFQTNIPAGGSRGDVAAAFPEAAGARQSGFSMAFNYSELAPGEHQITVRAVDAAGDFQERSAPFEVTRFEGPFLRDPALVDLRGARLRTEGFTLVLEEVVVDEGVYDLELRFRPATQGFALTSIRRVGTTVANAPSGTTTANARADCPPGETPAVVVSLEEPLGGSRYSGVSNIRGWSVGRTGLDRIELLVDGVFQTNIPAGGSRADVGRAFPDFPGANNSGYSMAFNYSNLTPGRHVLSVAAVATNGRRCEASTAFEVARFEGPFIRRLEQVGVPETTLGLEDPAIVLEQLPIEQPNTAAVFYDAQLAFRTATQGFALTQITEIPPPAPDGLIVSPADPVVRVKAGQSLRFRALALGTETPNFHWRFGDPAIPDSTEPEPLVQFNRPETIIPVSVTVSDAEGRTDPTPDSVDVVVLPANRPPQPTIEPNEPRALKINLDDTLAFRGFGNDPDGDDKLTYRWRFARLERARSTTRSNEAVGLTQNLAYRYEQNPTVRFERGGVHEVTLEVTDPEGLRGRASVEVSVYAPDDAER